MLTDIIAIIRDNWLLLLIGQYPNGPLGGFAATLILSVLSIVLAFPLSVLLALARLSTSRLLLWPSTALVYVARGVPLLMLILWVYFMVPLLIGAQRPGLRDDAGDAGDLRGRLPERGRARRHRGARPRARWRRRARSATATSARCVYVILPQALYNMMPSILSQFVSTIKETTLGYVINVPELTFAANQINNQLLTKPFQVFFILAIIYYVGLLEPDPAAAIALERRIARKRAGPRRRPPCRPHLTPQALTAEP